MRNERNNFEVLIRMKYRKYYLCLKNIINNRYDRLRYVRDFSRAMI